MNLGKSMLLWRKGGETVAENETFDGYPEPLREFASYKTVMGASPKTVSEYMLDLRTFSKYLYLKRQGAATDEESIKNTDISALDWSFYGSVRESEIYDFIGYAANGRNNKNASKARKLSAVRSFYKAASVKLHKLEDNPAKNVESPKKKQQLPKHLSMDECVELLSAVKNDKNSKHSIRDFCILTLFLNCGMRLSELCGISLGDIDRDLHSLRVVGKGSKERVVYLNSACREALLEYIPVRNADPALKKGENALFISRLGQRISVKTVQWMVKKYLGEAGLEYKHYSTHKLRHTAATLMYQSGDVDIRVLKDILGHEQLNTTQIYTHVSNEGMELAMDRNPLANIKIKENKQSEEKS